MARYTGPAAGQLAEFSRLLERNHNDGQVRDALGRLKPLARDAVSGQVMPCWHYRLDCGRIEQIWCQPLPDTKTALYCPSCGRERAIVESLGQVLDDDGA